MSVFEQKSSEELAKLDAAELGEYYAAKDAHNDSVIAEVTKKSENLEKSYKELSKFTDSQKELIEKNAAQLRAQAEKINTKSNVVTNENWLLKGLTSIGDKLKSIASKESPERFVIKAVGDMTKPTNISNSTLLPIPVFENRLTRIADRKPWISSIIRTGRINSDKYVWYDQSGREGAAGPTTEGALKNQIDFNIDPSTRYAKKYSAFIKVTTEFADDVNWLMSEVNNELITQLRLAVDADQLSGDGTGTGTAGQLFGLLTDATAFNAGSFALAVPEPNNIDVLTVAMDQVSAANYTANVILMNGRDVTQIRLDKASDGHYLGRLQDTADGMTLDGVPIIENNGMPVGQFLVMDAMLPQILEAQPLQIMNGYAGNDFLENKMSILAEWRGVQVVRENHKAGLVTGTFAAAITAITKP